MSKFISSDVEYRFREDFDNGSWGAATSHPFITETYFTPEETAEVKRRIKDMRDRAAEAMAKIPASKRVSSTFASGNICEELKEFAVPEYSTDYKNPIYNFRGIVDLFAGAIYAEYNNRGRYKYTAVLRDIDKISPKIPYYKDENRKDYGYGSYPTTTYTIHWSESKQTYVLRKFVRVWTDPIPETKRHRNWARGTKRNEFVRVCSNKFLEILHEGYVFSRLEYDKTRYSQKFLGYLFRKPEDEKFITDFYAKKEEEKRLAEEKAKAEAEAAKTPEQRAREQAEAEAAKKVKELKAELEIKISELKAEYAKMEAAITNNIIPVAQVAS